MRLSSRSSSPIRLIVLAFAVLCSAGLSRADDKPTTALAWHDWPAMPSGSFFAAGSVANDGKTIVITGGLNQLAQTTTTTQFYDIASQKWTLGPELPIRRMMHAQLTLDNHRILIVGGKTGDAPHHLTAIDDACVIDTQKQIVAPAPPLPQTMGQPTAHLLANGNALVVGNSTACVYDPAQNKWVASIKLQQAREAHCSVLLADERVMVIGGLNRESIELIDIKAGVSHLLDVALPHVTDDLRAALMPDGRVWVLGGQHSQTGDTHDRTFFITLASGEPPASPAKIHAMIAEGPRLGVKDGVSDQCIGRVGPFIFALGGESQQHDHDTELSAVRLLDPRVGKVFTLPNLAVPHDDAVALPIGNSIVVFGGYRVGTGVIPGIVMPTAQSRVEALSLPEEKLK